MGRSLDEWLIQAHPFRENKIIQVLHHFNMEKQQFSKEIQVCLIYLQLTSGVVLGGKQLFSLVYRRSSTRVSLDRINERLANQKIHSKYHF